MGATNFTNIETAKTAQDAFIKAGTAAPRGGYTGTIAEKHQFKMISRPAKFDSLVDWLDEKGWDNDKWDACYCIEITKAEYKPIAKYYGNLTPKRGEKIFVFFGTASC